MAKAKTFSKATKVERLTRYIGEVWLYELSKKIGNTKFVIGAEYVVASGGKKSAIWHSDETGKVTNNKPIKQESNIPVVDLFLDLGYKING